MSLPYAFIGGVYAILGHMHSHALELSDLMLQDQHVLIGNLKNGISACIHRNTIPPKSGTVRIIVDEASKEAASEKIVYSIEFPTENLDSLENYFYNWSEKYRTEPMGIVAVGDFPVFEMETLIERYFSAFPFKQEHSSPKELIVNENISDNVTLASYYTDQLLNPSGFVPYQFFSEAPEGIIECASSEELDDQTVMHRPSSASSTIREAIASSKTLQEENAEDIFEALPLNDGERKIIASIITTMADKNVVKLGLMKKTLEKKGKKIHHVHPFRFLGYVFSTPHLKNSMHKIKRSGFKWDGFIEGFSKKMKNEAENDNLMPYVSGFSKHLNVNHEQVARYVQKHDWEGLVRYLL